MILNIVISESYGEDIGHSDTDEDHDADDDSYESDFIDDREVPVPEKYGSDSIDDIDDECTLPRRHKQKGTRLTCLTLLYYLIFVRI